MGKLVLAQLARRIKSNFAVCVEVIVLIIVCNVLLGQLIPYVQGELLYKNCSLSQIVCCTSDAGEVTVEELASAVEASVLQRNYKSKVVSEEDLWLQPVSTSYVARIFSENIDVSAGGIPAIVPRSLSSKFKQDQSYSLTVYDMSEPVCFTVVHTLNNDMMFLPPAGNTVEMVSKSPNTVLLVVDDSTSELFELSDVYTMDVGSQDVNAVISLLTENGGVEMAMSVKAAREYSNTFDLHMMGMPIIIAVTVVLLCLAGMLSNTLLSVISNERLNSIYYICGYTWKKCAIVQAITDLLIVLCGILISLIVLLLLSKTDGSIQLQKFEFIISTGIALSIWILAETMGISQISKSNVAELAERIK